MSFRLFTVILLSLMFFAGCGSESTTDDGGTPKILFPNSQEVLLGSEYTGAIYDSPDNTDQTYKINITKTGVYTVYFELTTGTVDANTGFRIYDTQGVEIGNLWNRNLQSTGSWNRKTFEVLEPGTYYFRAERDESQQVIARFKFSIQPSVANGLVQNSDRELNDEQAMAAPITFLEVMNDINGSINITTVTDTDDWYELDLNKTGVYTVYFQILAGSYDSSRQLGGDTSLKIVDEYGAELLNVWQGVDKPGGFKRLTFDAYNIGTYYIHIDRNANQQTRYTYSIQPSIANGLVQDTNNEPNDEFVMATPITLAEATLDINGSVNITSALDLDDWYKISLQQTGTYTVDFKLTPGSLNQVTLSGDAVLAVTDQYESTVLALNGLNQEGDSKTDTFTVSSPGDYYIHILRGLNMKAAYTFNITRN